MLYAILIIALLVACWIGAQEKPLLHVKFKGGVIVWSKGEFPQRFKHNVIQIGEIVPFDGELKVLKINEGPLLLFSEMVPKKVQERIRNVYVEEGFSLDDD